MCARCEELEERVAWLESELGLQRLNNEYANLRAFMRSRLPGGRSHAIGFVLALFRAKGRTLTHQQIIEATQQDGDCDDDRDLGVTKVWACFARKCLGADAVESVWGRGYRLTPIGIAQVSEVLAERQAAA